MRILKNRNKVNVVTIIIGNSWRSEYIVAGVVVLYLSHKALRTNIDHSYTIYRDEILKLIL